MRSVMKNIGWAAASQGIVAVASMVETVLLARALSLELFGTFTVLFSTSELIFGLLDFRTGQAAIKFIPELRQITGRDAVSGFIRLVLMIDAGVALVGLVVIFFFGSLIVQLTDMPTDYLHLLAILGVGGALRSIVRSAGALLRVSGDFVKSIKLGIAIALARLAIIATVVFVNPTVELVSGGVAASDALFFLLFGIAAVVSMRRQGYNPLRASLQDIAPERKMITSFLLNTNVESTIRVFSNKLDILVIAALSSPSVVAIYKLATRFAGSLLLFSDPLILALYPEMSQLRSQGEMAQLQRLLRLLTTLLSIFAVSVFVGFLLFGDWVLLAVAGPGYTEAYGVILIMLCGTSMAMIFFWARPLLLIHGKAKHLVMIAASATVCEFLALYLLVPVMGATGAAIGFGLFYAINGLTYFYVYSALTVVPSIDTGSVQ